MRKTVFYILFLFFIPLFASAEDVFVDSDDILALDSLHQPPPMIRAESNDDSAALASITEPTVEENFAPQRVVPDEIYQINSLSSDEQKIKEWAKHIKEPYYVIVDKKNCLATIYDTYGNRIKSFEIGIGREIGDDFNDTLGKVGKSKNTTPAGEFTLVKNVINTSAYGDFTLSLGQKANKPEKSKKVVALHKVPKFREQDRLKKFYDGDIANNRMSHGCINFLEDDFNEFTKYIREGLKTYILPEESDNELQLITNVDGEYELSQTKY